MNADHYFLLVWSDVAILGIFMIHALRGAFRLKGVTWATFRQDAWLYSFALSASQVGQILWLNFFSPPRVSGDGALADLVTPVTYPLSFAAPLVALITTDYRMLALRVGLASCVLTWIIPIVIVSANR